MNLPESVLAHRLPGFPSPQLISTLRDTNRTYRLFLLAPSRAVLPTLENTAISPETAAQDLRTRLQHQPALGCSSKLDIQENIWMTGAKKEKQGIYLNT